MTKKEFLQAIENLPAETRKEVSENLQEARMYINAAECALINTDLNMCSFYELGKKFTIWQCIYHVGLAFDQPISKPLQTNPETLLEFIN
jgi:hypothetical protein